MKIRFKAARQLVTYFFTFPLLLEYKTDFPVIINLPQRFTAMISVSRHVSSAVSHNIRIADGSGEWNEKCSTVVAWFDQPGDPSTILTERERKDNFEHREKNQTAVFCRAQEEV